MLVDCEPQCLGEVPFAYRAHSQGVAYLREGQLPVHAAGSQMRIELFAHMLDLGIGLFANLGEHLSFLAGEPHRVSESLAAEVGPAGVVGVVDPDSRRLVLNIERNKFDIEKGEEAASAALFTPFTISVERIEIVYSHNLHTFFLSHFQRLGHVVECAERVRCMQVGVYIYNTHTRFLSWPLQSAGQQSYC